MPDKDKTCPRCGYENRSSAFRCWLCGMPFINSSATATLASVVPSEVHSSDNAHVTYAERIDFANQIASNRYKSILLFFVLFVVLTLLGMAIGNFYGYPEYGGAFAIIIAVIIAIAAFFGGASAILGISQARPADRVADRQLINLVEEMAIAAGQPKPKVYVIESDELNAFATGRDPENAVIAVTRGLAKILNREELQGVVAHEMSHIRNYDIRFMMLVAALVGAVILIADGFRRSIWYGGSRGGRRSGGGKGGGQAAIILMLISLLFIILAPLFAMLLQMAVSRRREFLADASAVELTRNPAALANALEKIENSVVTGVLPGASKATQHIYIANPLRVFGMRSSALMSTHPPMQARIKIIRAMV